MSTARQSIAVRHNVEMGHRLSMQPNSKCFHFHGHSWWVELEISGEVGQDGMILDFAVVKHAWRHMLDVDFDHHMCLNVNDPLFDRCEVDDSWGFVTVECDPTVENMARIWGEWARKCFGEQYDYYIKVWEAATNAATWRARAQVE